MRIFKLTLFLGLCILCAVLDFLFIETSPFVVRAALSAAAIAAIAGGSALIGGVGNLLSSADTNEANKEINRENREWQTQENEKNRNWSQKMWEAENVYNTPSAQMARMKSAGLNPYLVQGQGASAGNAGSPTSPAAQSAPSSIPQQRPDFGFIGQAGANAVEAYNSVRSTDANVANQSAQFDKTVIDNAKELYRLTGDKNRVNSYMDSQLQSSKGVSFDPETSPLAKSLKAEVTKTNMDADLADSERAVNDAQASIIRLLGYRQGLATIRNLDAMTEKYFGEFNKLTSDVEVNKANVKYINKRAYAIGSEMAKNLAEAKYFGANANTISLSTEYVVEKFKYDAKNSWINTMQNGLTYSQRMSNWRATKLIRDYRESSEGQDRLLWNYQQSPQGNYANSFLNGLTNSLNIMHNSDTFNSHNFNVWPSE